MTKTEARALITKLSKQYAPLFGGIKKEAKVLPKAQFIKANVPKAKMAGPFIGQKINDADAKIVLAEGWEMIKAGEV